MKAPISVILFFFLASTSQLAAEKTDHPHIILCMADDQGFGDTGYNGHPFVKTPHMDKMAANGLRFDRFYAAASVCSPTRASVMTGRNPIRSNVPDHGRSMRPQEITVAEALKTAGYVTGHFGKWHIGSVEKSSPVSPGAAGFDEWLSAMNFFDLNPYMSHNGKAVKLEGESSMITVDGTIDFLRKNAKSGQPMFCVVWFASPHDPFQALGDDLKLYEGKKLAGYYREMTAMDRAIGKLRKELIDLGIHENTLFWYCSDNGGLNTETSGGRMKKGSVYEGGLRVPAYIEWPARIAKGSTSSTPCFTSDIYPTLLDLVDVKIDNQPVLDGESIVNLIDGNEFDRKSAMKFWNWRGSGRSTWSDRIIKKLYDAQKEGREIGDPSRLDLDAAEIKTVYPEDVLHGHSTINDWPWKLHRIRAKSGDVSLELYDLEKDPMESSNVLKDHKDMAGKMVRELEEWQRSVIRSRNGEDYK